MFQNHTAEQNTPFASKSFLLAKIDQNGPFLFQKVGKMKSQCRRRSHEWPNDSQLRYLACISAYKQELEEHRGRELWSIYKKISQMVPSRNPNQCRIHHKHMLRNHQNIDAILSTHAKYLRPNASIFHHYQQEAQLLKRQMPTGSPNLQRARIQKSVIIEDPQIAHKINKPNAQEGDDWGEDKKHEDNIATDIAYPEQIKNEPQRRTNRGGYMQFCQAMPMFSESHFNLGMSEQRKKDWEECHQLFLAWTNKLHSLIHS